MRGFFTNPSKADDSFIPFKNNIDSGKFTIKTGTQTVNLGYRPKILIVFVSATDSLKVNQSRMNIYIDGISQNHKHQGASGGESSYISIDSNVGLTSVTDTGFSVSYNVTSTRYVNWFAVK